MAIPIGSVLIYAFMILVTTFFVTSADSSTLAVSMMTTGGKAKPSNINRIFWGVVLGLTAAILMILGGSGSANTLQQAAIITGTPFAFVCFLAMLSLIKDFRGELRSGALPERDRAVGIGEGRRLPVQFGRICRVRRRLTAVTAGSYCIYNKF